MKTKSFLNSNNKLIFILVIIVFLILFSGIAYLVLNTSEEESLSDSSINEQSNNEDVEDFSLTLNR